MQKKLKLFRQVFDVSIILFAEMIGVTRQTIYNIENEKTVLTKTQYLAICQTLRSLLNKNPDKYTIVKNIWESDYDFTFEALFEEIYKLPRFSVFYDGGKLGKPEAWWLQPESNMLYRDIMVYRGAPANQLKPVRVILNEKQRKFFFACIQNHFFQTLKTFNVICCRKYFYFSSHTMCRGNYTNL